MKKFMKFVVGIIAIGVAVAAGIYFFKNIFMKDYMDDPEEDDFDSDFFDDDREYVKITPDVSDGEK